MNPVLFNVFMWLCGSWIVPPTCCTRRKLNHFPKKKFRKVHAFCISPGDDFETSLLSFEKLDRASPDLWPEQSKSVSLSLISIVTMELCFRIISWIVNYLVQCLELQNLPRLVKMWVWHALIYKLNCYTGMKLNNGGLICRTTLGVFYIPAYQ